MSRTSSPTPVTVLYNMSFLAVALYSWWNTPLGYHRSDHASTSCPARRHARSGNPANRRLKDSEVYGWIVFMIVGT